MYSLCQRYVPYVLVSVSKTVRPAQIKHCYGTLVEAMNTTIDVIADDAASGGLISSGTGNDLFVPKLTKVKHGREERAKITAEFNKTLDELPQLKYPHYYSVECLSSMDKVNQTMIQLMKKEGPTIYGVDIEWQPTFIKGQPEKKTSLMQICDHQRILLIQLSRMSKFPTQLRCFLEDRNILKSGVNIAADGHKLFRDFGISTNGLVELKDLAEITRSPKLNEIHLRSLRALTGLFLGQNMNKGKVRVSNWGSSYLTNTQIEYAALDAYASYQLFVELDKMRDPSHHMPIRHLMDEGYTPTPSTTDTSSNSSTKLIQRKQPKMSSTTKYRLSIPTSTTTIICKKKFVESRFN